MADSSVVKITGPSDPIFDKSSIKNCTHEEKQRKFALLTSALENECKDVRREALKTVKLLCVAYRPTDSLLQKFISQCDNKLKPQLDKMVNEKDEMWPELWQFIVTLLGVDLHNVKTLLNNYLGVLEKAMKKKDPESVEAAFKCWITLIDNFSLNPDVLSAPRRVELLIIPLKSKLAKSPSTLTIKFYTWWHLILKLESNIAKHCDSVLKNFIVFCFGPFGRDENVKMLKLAYRVPQLLPLLLKSLSVILGSGVSIIEQKVLVPHADFELPIVPIIPSFQSFTQVFEVLMQAVADVIHFFPDEENSILAFEALITRLCESKLQDESHWQNAASQLLTLVEEVTLCKKDQATQPFNLTVCLVNCILSTWDKTLLNSHIKHLAATPHKFLLRLVLKQIPFMLTSGADSDKYEERFVKLLHKLVKNREVMIAGPESLSDFGEIVQALEGASNLEQLIKDQTLLKRVFTLWDQFVRIVPKILPSETTNEDCNAVSKDYLMRLMLLPIRCIIENDTSLKVRSLFSNWKLILQKFVDVSALSLSVDKHHPISEICEQILNILQEKTHRITSIYALVFVSSQMVAIRSSGANKINLQVSEAPSEVDLLAKIANILSTINSTDYARLRNVLMHFANTLQSLLILQTNMQCVVDIFKIVFTLLMIPTTNINIHDGNMTDVIPVFPGLFTTNLSNNSPDTISRETKQLLKELLPNIVQLKLHKNVKVQQGALELEDALNTCIYKSNRAAATAHVIMKGNEQKPSSPRTFISPASYPLGTKRTRKSLKNPVAAAIASTSPTSSPKSKPVLEDQDSQDFVKIAPKPKGKAVLTPHQRETRRKRRDDIPALYQGLSQDTFNSDTQDTQDSAMEIVPPLVTSTSNFIPFSEDASDVCLDFASKSKQKRVSQSSKDTTAAENQSQPMPSSEGLRHILEPIQPESKANKNSQEITAEDDVILIENNPPNQTVELKKNDGPVPIERTSKENIRDNELSTVKDCDIAVKVPVTPVLSASEATPNKVVDDDDIVILRETKIPKVVISKAAIAEKSEDVSTSQETAVEDTQDVDFVESSQTNVIFPAKDETLPVIEARSSEATDLTITKRFARVRNRQGVSLPTRTPRASADVINEEKPANMQGRYSSCRAAKLLEMVHACAAPSTAEPKATVKEIEAPGVNKTKAASQVIEINNEIEDAVLEPSGATLPAEPSLDSNIPPIASEGEFETESEMEVEEATTEEASPEKSFSLVYVSTPTSANKRSNLKRILDSVDVKTPSPKKAKRVSFAEPVVSGEQESPKILSEEATFKSLYKNNSPKLSSRKKEHRVSRKLMLFATGRSGRDRGTPEMITISETVTTSTSQGSLPAEVPSDIPVYPPLVQCKHPIELIAPMLCSPMLVPALVEKLKNSNILTVGHLSSLKEICVNSLEIKEPKIENLKLALTEYETSKSPDPAPLPDTVPLNTDVVLEDLTTRIDDEPEVSTSVVEKEDDAEENSLQKQLQTLLKQYTLENVLQALGQQGSTSETTEDKQEILEGTNENEIQVLLKQKDRQKLVSNIATALSPDEVIQVVSLQKQDRGCEKVPITQVLQAVGREQEIIDHVVKQNEPLNVIKSALQVHASNTTPQSAVKEITTNMKTSDLLSTFGREDEVLDYVVSHSAPDTVIAKILNRFPLCQLLKSIGKFDELTHYVVSQSNATDIIKKCVEIASISDVLDAVGREEEILNYSLKHSNPLHVLKKVTDLHSAAQVLESFGREDDVLEHIVKHRDPQDILKKIVEKTPIQDVLGALDIGKVLDAVLQMSDPVYLITDAAKLLKDGDLKIVIDSLEDGQLADVCSALPTSAVQRFIETSREASTEKKEATNMLLLSSFSNSELIMEFNERCLNIKLTTSDLTVDFAEAILPLIPDEVKMEAFQSAVESGENDNIGNIKEIVLQNTPWSELLKFVIDQCNNEDLTFEENLVTENERQLLQDICNLLPMSAVSKRLAGIASGATEEIRAALLKMFSSTAILELFSKMQSPSDMETKELICTTMVKGLPVLKVLMLLDDKLAEEKLTRKVINVLQTWYTTYLPDMNAFSVLKAKPLAKDVRLEALEYLINLTPIKDIMSMLPIKDVIQYYETLIAMPECKAPLLRTSLECVPVDDLIRFLGATKILKAIKCDLDSNHPTIAVTQVVKLLPSSHIADQLSKLTNTEQTLTMLRTHFPRAILIKLVSELLQQRDEPQIQ